MSADDAGSPGASDSVIDAAPVNSVVDTNGTVTVTDSLSNNIELGDLAASGLASPAVVEGSGPAAGSLAGFSEFFDSFYGGDIINGPENQSGAPAQTGFSFGEQGFVGPPTQGDLANQLGQSLFGGYIENPDLVGPISQGPPPLGLNQISFGTQLSLAKADFVQAFQTITQVGPSLAQQALGFISNPLGTITNAIFGPPPQGPTTGAQQGQGLVSQGQGQGLTTGQQTVVALAGLVNPALGAVVSAGLQAQNQNAPVGANSGAVAPGGLTAAQNAALNAFAAQIPGGQAIVAFAQQQAAANAVSNAILASDQSSGVIGAAPPAAPSGTSFGSGGTPPVPGDADPNAPAGTLTAAQLQQLRILQLSGQVSPEQDPGGGGGGGGDFFGNLLKGAGLITAGVAAYNAISPLFNNKPTSYSLEAFGSYSENIPPTGPVTISSAAIPASEAFGAYGENVPPTGPVTVSSAAIPASEAFGSYAENVAPTGSFRSIGSQILSDITAAANNIRTALPQVLPFLQTAQNVAGAFGVQLPGAAQATQVAGILNTTDTVVRTVSGLTGNAAQNPFAVAEDPLNAQYSVYNTRTGTVLETGLTQEEAQRRVAGLGIVSNATLLATGGQTSLDSVLTGLRAITGTPQGINAIGAVSGIVTKQNDFGVLEDPLNGSYSIYNKVNNTVIEAGLSQEDANKRVQALGIFSSAVNLATQGQTSIGAIVAGLPTGSNAINAITGLAAQQTQFGIAQDPSTGTYSVYNRNTGQTVLTGLTEQQAREQAQAQGVITAALSLASQGGTTTVNNAILNSLFPSTGASGTAGVGTTAINLGTGANAGSANGATNVTALANQLRQQQSVRELRQSKAQSSDWRVRLRLGPNSDYLYNDPTNGLLAPLSKQTGTDGVIFPYTPTIETTYKANYDAYDLTHSNYRGYFYRNSYVDAVSLRAQFTAQDTNEADYLLAVIHFFRSVTKMFYGQDAQRGTPPPLVYLSGLGNLQFAEHPCLISQFNYVLPPDVDYIRANSVLSANTNLLGSRTRSTSSANPLAYTINRLLNNKLTQGAQDNRPSITTNLGAGNPSYVPTKMEISLTLLPVQTRTQASQQFSVKAFANGNLLSNGFW